MTIHKHLSMIFDSKLSFDKHLKSVLKKISKTVGLLQKFQDILPRTSSITIYKLFARPHLDYGYKIYDETFNESFHQRIESMQYNTAIAITGAIRGTSSEKLVRLSDSVNVFKLSLLKFVRPVANSVFEIYNPYGLKLPRRFCLGLTHLRYHKFRHNFQDCIKPICVFGLEIETITHFLLHCPIFQCARQSLLTNIKKINESILKKHDTLITKTLLHGDDQFDLSCNELIISSTIEFIVFTEIFSNSLV